MSIVAISHDDEVRLPVGCQASHVNFLFLSAVVVEKQA